MKSDKFLSLDSLKYFYDKIKTLLSGKQDKLSNNTSGTSGDSGWYDCRLTNDGKVQYYNTTGSSSGVTSITTQNGITGGTITSTGTIGLSLQSTTPSSKAAAADSSSVGQYEYGSYYPVELDANGNLAVQIRKDFIYSIATVKEGGTGRTSLTRNALLTGNNDSDVNLIQTVSGALYATSSGGVAQFGTLPTAQGGTGTSASSISELAATLNSSRLVSVSDLDTLTDNCFFMGQGTSQDPDPFTSIDFVGVNIYGNPAGSNVDWIQIASFALTSHRKLMFRKNDEGTWTSWESIALLSEVPISNEVVDSIGTGNAITALKIENGQLKATRGSFLTSSDVTTSVTNGSSKVVTSGAVYTQLSYKLSTSSVGDCVYMYKHDYISDTDSYIPTCGAVFDAVNGPGESISSGSNLNDYTTPGRYVTTSATISGSLTNAPSGGTNAAALLIVTYIQSTSYIRQVWYTQAGASAFFVRHYRASNGWTSWYKYAGTAV